jgi:general secretion pathway protein D
LIFTFSVSAQSNIENMNFKNADLVDVLRAIAEVADVNLITDSSVSGTITVNFKNISFKKSLDLITKSRALDYRWDENTVVVASPDRLDSIYANIVTEFVKVNSSSFDNIATIIKEIFPETQITLDPARRQFILKGEKEKIVEIKEMINRLDSLKTFRNIETQEKVAESNKKEIEIYTDSYHVLNA